MLGSRGKDDVAREGVISNIPYEVVADTADTLEFPLKGIAEVLACSGAVLGKTCGAQFRFNEAGNSCSQYYRLKNTTVGFFGNIQVILSIQGYSPFGDHSTILGIQLTSYSLRFFKLIHTEIL